MPSDFRKLMAARFLFTLAVQIQAIVLGWQMYILTKDPLFLGLIGLVEAIPALGLAIYAGYIVDRSRPLLIFRRVVAISLLFWIHPSDLTTSFDRRKPSASDHGSLSFFFPHGYGSSFLPALDLCACSANYRPRDSASSFGLDGIVVASCSYFRAGLRGTLFRLDGCVGFGGDRLPCLNSSCRDYIAHPLFSQSSSAFRQAPVQKDGTSFGRKVCHSPPHSFSGAQPRHDFRSLWRSDRLTSHLCS